jgi:hypothetical protein
MNSLWLICPDDRGRNFLRNICKHVPGSTLLHPTLSARLIFGLVMLKPMSCFTKLFHLSTNHWRLNNCIIIHHLTFVSTVLRTSCWNLWLSWHSPVKMSGWHRSSFSTSFKVAWHTISSFYIHSLYATVLLNGSIHITSNDCTIVNNKLTGCGRKLSWPDLNYYPWILPWSAEETQNEASVRVVDIPVRIWTGNLPNTRQKCHRSQFLRFIVTIRMQKHVNL